MLLKDICSFLLDITIPYPSLGPLIAIFIFFSVYHSDKILKNILYSIITLIIFIYAIVFHFSFNGLKYGLIKLPFFLALIILYKWQQNKHIRIEK